MTAEQRNNFEFWIKSSEDDWRDAEFLLESHKYPWALFLIHLSLEKLIKALIIKNGTSPRHIHDLKVLYEQIDVVPDQYGSWLNEITTFNTEARYISDKLLLRHRATTEFTNQWHDHAKELRQWLKQQLD